MANILFLGSGNSPLTRRLCKANEPSEFSPSDIITTLDIDPSCSPTIVHDLNILPWPLPSSTFDEIHCYEVLEHLGQQGDYKSFFAHFSELYRILKPNALLFGTCPSYTSMWAWGDPGHTRLITKGSLAFLHQAQYSHQVGSTSMTDYRSLYKADLAPIYINETPDQLLFVLQALKS